MSHVISDMKTRQTFFSSISWVGILKPWLAIFFSVFYEYIIRFIKWRLKAQKKSRKRFRMPIVNYKSSETAINYQGNQVFFTSRHFGFSVRFCSEFISQFLLLLIKKECYFQRKKASRRFWVSVFLNFIMYLSWVMRRKHILDDCKYLDRNFSLFHWLM